MVCLLLFSPAFAQELPQPTPSPVPTAVTPQASTPAPSEPAQRPTSAYLVKSPVTSRTLFPVAGKGDYSPQERANLISRRLKQIVDSSPTSSPKVSIEKKGDEVHLKVNDKLLASVLPHDVLAQPGYHKVTPSSLLAVAQAWQHTLQLDLREGKFLTSPDYKWAVSVFLLLSFGLSVFLHRKSESRRVAQSTALPTWLLKTAIWTVFLTVSLWSIPGARKWAITVYHTAFQPVFWLIGVILACSVALHIFEKVVEKYFSGLVEENTPTFSRQYRRLHTLEQVALVTGRIVLVVAAAAVYLSLLPINYGPLLASASVLSVALGFASQDVLKDLFAGVSILAEDHFGVGDWIEWNGQQGAVEYFNLKSTKIRKIDGSVLMVGNSDLRVVCNLSNEWSQVDYKVGIAYEADFRLAEKCLLEEAEKLRIDWPERILGNPELKGLQTLGDSSVTLRLFLRTIPLAQWDVERELNARVKTRFDAEGISIPYPQRRVWLSQVPPVTTPEEISEKGT